MTDREILIKHLKYCSQYDANCMECERWDADCGDSRCVEDLMAKAAVALEQQKWIPVSERLPNWKDGKVLVFTKYGLSICERTVNYRWKGQHANWITHWMPLPEPPKEDIYD